MFKNKLLQRKKNREMFSILDDQLHCVLDKGIGNRVIHLVSAMRVAENNGLALHAWWINQGIGATYDQCFKPIEGVAIQSVENKKALPSDLQDLQPGSWLWFLPEEIEPEHSSAYPDRKIWGRVLGVPRMGYKFFVQLTWITPALQKLYQPFFQQIRFQDAVLSQIHSGWGGVDPSSVIGVHIRFAPDMKKKLMKGGLAELTSLEVVLPILEKYINSCGKSNVFVATDIPEVLSRVEDPLGSRLITQRKREHGRGELKNIISALVDLGMLSQCSRLFLTCSSFGLTAWWLGGCVDALRLDSLYVEGDIEKGVSL